MMNRWLAWAGDPGSLPREAALWRGAAGLVFLVSGAVKLVHENQGVARFAKIGFPSPGAVAGFVGVVEIVFGASDQLFDLTSYTTHIGRDTTGDLLSKAALLERSRTYLKGLITIEKTAIGTDSFLGEFGMNLSKAARSVAIPSLEIDQPDCRRAAHSSSVGPVDEGQLFYLETRGIPPDEARKFIVLGFLEPVVARVPLASAQERLRELLEARWIEGTGAAASAAA